MLRLILAPTAVLAAERRYFAITEKHTASRRRKRKWSGKDAAILILIVVAAVSVAVAVWAVGSRSPSTPTAGAQQEQTEEPAEKLTDSIDIPGFGDLHFKAGQTEQDLSVPNPEQNFCWFKVSLVLEDGTVLWTSDLIAPGEESGKVVLNEPLEKGEYENAMLKYQCFADEAGQNALNGAETKLTIIVK